MYVLILVLSKYASNTHTSTYKITPILWTDSTFMLDDITFSFILQIIESKKIKNKMSVV